MYKPTVLDCNRKEHGFVGHLAEPQRPNGRAVIVIMGGEQSDLRIMDSLIYRNHVQEFG